MSKNNFDYVLIYTDGACSGNPGRGGWACIVATPAGEVNEYGGFELETTNNRMELTATIAALAKLQNYSGKIRLYTDSTYVIRGITQWIWGWKKKDWKNGDGQDVANKDLWEQLYSYSSKHKNKIEWLYSRGHVGTPGNERCDEIAVCFSQKKFVQLYSGPLLKYSVAIFDEPAETELPEIKPREEKKVAHSYLSYLNGELYRHKNWASCERRVKGRSGAKFKKAMSPADEEVIVAEWGLSLSEARDSD